MALDSQEIRSTAVSQHLDARDHAVLMDLKRYAEGRSDIDQCSSLARITRRAWICTRSIVAHHTVGRLIDEEWLRYARTQLVCPPSVSTLG